MPWMLLKPREVEAITRNEYPTPTTTNGILLREIQAKLQGDELDLSDADMERVRVAAGNWTGGYERAFRAILDAEKRHV